MGFLFGMVVFSLCLLTPFAQGQQEQQAARPQPDTLLVAADGEFESAPDTAVITFMIAAQENDPQTAFSHASQAAERMRGVLKSNGIDPKMAELSRYDLQPVYDYKSPKQKIVAYRVSTSVTLKLKDFSKAGSLLQGFSTIEETQGQNLSYTLEQMDDAKNKAIEKAYERARGYAATMAKASGRTLGDLSYASIDVRGYERPIPMMGRATMAASAAIPAPTEGFAEQKITVSAHVTASFKLR
jgi:uncharacterized protein YggE